MAPLVPTTDDVGAAIRDALDLIECFQIGEATDDHGEDAKTAVIDHIDDSDLSNLEILAGGAVYVIRVIRKGV